MPSCRVSEWRVCVDTVWVSEHVWPPPSSKWPLSWQSAPGPRAAAGSVCPSREPPGGGGRQRCRGRTQTRGGPAGERLHLERLRKRRRRRRGDSSQRGWGGDLHVLSHPILHTFTHTFTVSNLLFDIVHFQVFWNWSSPEENISTQVRSYSNLTSAAQLGLMVS